MKGTILSVDVNNGSGVIHGENYLPYKFDMTGWNESNCYPVKGMGVNFEVGDSFSAYKITINTSSKKIKNPINLWSISLKLGAFVVISMFLLATFFFPFWDDYQTKKAKKDFTSESEKLSPQLTESSKQTPATDKNLGSSFISNNRDIYGYFSVPYTYFSGQLNDEAQGDLCSIVPYDERIKSFNNSGFSFGDQLTLKDAEGNIIGIYTLNDGTMLRQGEKRIQNTDGMVTLKGVYDFNCVITFEFKGVPDSAFYQLSTNRKNFTISREDLISKKWNIPLEF